MSYSYITTWLPKEDAQAMVKSLISEGKFKKGEIKLSSYRWADLKDHSKGYVARVHVLTGLHPDMELGLCGRKKKAQKAEAEPVEEVEKDTDRDNFMSAEEAKKYGLIDKIYAKRQ